MNSYSYHNKRKPAMCRSTFMRSEEIAQERAGSGWNQYTGEEEESGMYMGRMEQGRMDQGMMNQERVGQSMEDQSQMEVQWQHPGQQWNNQAMPRSDQQWNNQAMPRSDQQWSGQPEARPYFAGIDYEQLLEEQKEVERDLRMLQSMYPEAAKMILPHIEDVCDRMEYEGSMMFDRYPDQTTIQRMQDEIFQNVRDQFPDEEEPEGPDEMFSMQYQERRRPGRRTRLEDLIRVLLLQEMHHRRGRRRNRRRRY